MWLRAFGWTIFLSPKYIFVVDFTCCSPFDVKGTSVDPVCCCFKDHSVSPWRMRKILEVMLLLSQAIQCVGLLTCREVDALLRRKRARLQLCLYSFVICMHLQQCRQCRNQSSVWTQKLLNGTSSIGLISIQEKCDIIGRPALTFGLPEQNTDYIFVPASSILRHFKNDSQANVMLK